MTAARTASPVLVTAGDNVVDCYPDLGVMYPGGNTVNVAVHARRCGARTAWIGALGTDEAGALLTDALRAEDVDTDLVRIEPGPNAHAVVRVVDGDRVFGSGEVGVSRFELRDRDLLALAAADLVHTGECSMLEDQLPLMHSRARRLSYDFSVRPWDYIAEYAPHADIAIISADGDHPDEAELIRRVAALGPDVVVVTRGAGGAVLWSAGRTVEAPAGTGPIVDTLGAGDAFIARLLVGLGRQLDPAAALAEATRYATDSCAVYGAFGYESPLPAGLVSAAPVSVTRS